MPETLLVKFRHEEECGPEGTTPAVAEDELLDVDGVKDVEAARNQRNVDGTFEYRVEFVSDVDGVRPRDAAVHRLENAHLEGYVQAGNGEDYVVTA